MKTQRILAATFVMIFMVSFQSIANAIGGGGKSADAKFAYSLRSVKNTDKIVLSFDNLSKQKVTISIYDAANKLVFKETQYSTPTLRKGYDLSSLEDGKYTVKIESDNFSFKEEVEIGKDWNDLAFDAVIAPDPVSSNKLRIGFANAKGDVTVEIKDIRGNIVHTAEFSSQYGNELFNMKKLNRGEYTVTVYSGDQVFSDTYIVE